jgi:AcrR family transcriptional regulator
MPPTGGTRRNPASGSREGDGGEARPPSQRAKQRKRLLSAMTETVAEQGYASTTIADIVTRADVSRQTFYQHFAGKRECLLDTYDAIVADYMRAIASAYRLGGNPTQRAEAGLRALFERAAADPDALRLVTIEVAGAGEEGIARREQLVSSFEGFLRESLTLAPRPGTIANPILRAISGGLARVMYTRTQGGEQTDLPQLVDDLVSWTTSYAPPATMTRFRDPKPSRPGMPYGPWGGRAPGTLSLGAPAARTGGPARRERDVSRSFLIHSRRERILDAVANLTAESGYTAVTVERIAREAGVSAAAFHEHFAGREDAFLVAYELGHSKAIAIVERAFVAEISWRAGVRAGISALFDFLAAEPSFAHLALVEAIIATRRSAERSRRGVSAYAQMLLPGLQQAHTGSGQPAVTIEAITGGIFELCASYAQRGRIAELSELVPRATYFALAPFIGAEEAARVATEPRSRAQLSS